MVTPNKLYNSALFYRQIGYSVIPIHGSNSPGKFKASAVRWSAYQQHRATESTLKNWFLQQQHGGLAIVCGSVSGLAVLDFDNADLAKLFVELYPDLAQTRIVRSGGRGLPHFYFHVPEYISNVRSRSTQGVDWQYDGRYVVAPPTEGESGTWQVVNDVSPKIVTETDLRRIMLFLDSIPTGSNLPPLKTHSVSSEAKSGLHVDSYATTVLTPEHLVKRYQSFLHQGRNNALFITCRWLRDLGGTIDDAMALVPVHVHQPAFAPHPPESPEKRRKEALSTIMSVFRRPSGFQKPQTHTYIPNSLREVMLRHKQTAVLRVLEALVKAGWHSGKIFSRSDVMTVVSTYEIGDWSVRKTLNAVTPAEKPIFRQAANAAIAATDCGDISPQLNAIELRATKPTKNRGRPQKQYIMPDLHALCVSYAVKWTSGDPIELANLTSALQYRQALHAAFLRRSPGQYFKGWLSNRLGVSKRTLLRYNKQLGVEVQPVYRERLITWRTLGVIPHDLTVQDYGAFLEDETGKRYPPLLPIARKLLRRGVQFTYKLRLANHYRMPLQVDTTALPQADFFVSEVTEAKSVNVASAATISADEATTTNPNLIPSNRPTVPTVSEEVTLNPSQEQVAQLLHEAMQGVMALERARWLVQEYGQFAVSDVLDTLRERGAKISNPAGFVTSLLDARYGKTLTAGMDVNAVMLAESLYITIKWHNPERAMRWTKCCDLVRQHGQQRVGDLLSELNTYEQGDLHSAAGFVIRQLGSDVVCKCEPETGDTIVKSLVEVTRQCNPQRALAVSKAKELVAKYGVKLVSKAVHVVRSRTNIQNGAGFIIEFLRSEAKAEKKSRVTTL